MLFETIKLIPDIKEPSLFFTKIEYEEFIFIILSILEDFTTFSKMYNWHKTQSY
jgi:hypothetical protein